MRGQFDYYQDMNIDNAIEKHQGVLNSHNLHHLTPQLTFITHNSLGDKNDVIKFWQGRKLLNYSGKHWT